MIQLPTMRFKINKCPSDTLALLNCVIVSPTDLDGIRYVRVCPDHNPAGYAFEIRYLS